MTELEELKLKVGQRVSLSPDEGPTEYGIVVAMWLHPQLHCRDCYVAFFGHEWPRPGGQPPKPYILRYFASSLTIED